MCACNLNIFNSQKKRRHSSARPSLPQPATAAEEEKTDGRVDVPAAADDNHLCARPLPPPPPRGGPAQTRDGRRQPTFSPSLLQPAAAAEPAIHSLTPYLSSQSVSPPPRLLLAPSDIFGWTR